MDEFTEDRTPLEVARDALSVRMNALVNPLADRTDLALTMTWTEMSVPGQPDAPAWFDPATGWVTVNGLVALGENVNPDDVEPRTPEGRVAHPELVGLLCHEASHAHSTRWGAGGLNGGDWGAAARKAAILLEEPRIEHRQLMRRPQDRPYLRAQSVLIDLKGFTGKARGDDAAAMNRWNAATVALLVLGRLDAKVLDREDVLPVVPLLKKALGDDLAALRAIWRRALRVPDGDTEALLTLGQEWVDVLGDPPDNFDPSSASCSASEKGSGADTGQDAGSPSESDGEGADGGAAGGDEGADDGGDSTEEDWAEAISKAFSHAAAEADREIEAAQHAQQVMNAVKQKDDDRSKQADAAASSKAVFQFSTHGYGAGRGSAITGQRQPFDAERRLARHLSETLRRAQFRDRTKTKVRADTPPGRMDGREMMQAHAQRARGQMVTARPFVAVRRKHVEEPPISLGIMVDISGSMGWATKILASTSWAFSHAVYSIHGTSATVAFGDTVIPVVNPGTPPNMVTEFRANGGWEEFSEGFKALDGALNLTTGTGVRVLVVVSDGMLVADGEAAYAAEAVSRMRRNGGHVLWVGLAGATAPEGAVPVEVDAAQGVESIPEALKSALETALHTSH